MKNIREKHAWMGVLESTAGGSIVSAIYLKSWGLGMLAAILTVIAIGLHELLIEDEEQEFNGKS